MLWSWTRGVQANLSEIEWSGAQGACPVLCSLAGVVNVYLRCTPLDDDEEPDWDAIGFPIPTDQKRENVGWLGGRQVLLDYDVSWNDCPHGVSQDLEPAA